MIRALLAFFLALPVLGNSITGVAIETNGWQVLVYTTGLGSGGTYSMGLRQGPQAGPSDYVWLRSGAEKVRVRVQSPGYDTSRQPITRYRDVVATFPMRLPYPNQATKDERSITGGLQLRFALDWPVYAGDTIGTADILAGLYAHGGTNLVGATGLEVTNNSALPYHKVIANWTWPGFNRELGPDMYLRAFGMAPFARDGLPLAGLHFIVSDQSGNTTTNAATFGIDPILGALDPHKTAEYWAAIPLTPFAITNRLRCDFQAFPWLGTTNEILDTSLLAANWPQPHPWPSSITNLNDWTRIYSSAVAVVDPSIGADSAGRVTNVTYSSVITNHYFATISGAMNACSGTNNLLYGHADAGGAKIYVRSATVNMWGGTSSSNTIPAAWTEVIEYPGDTVTFTGDTGDSDLNDRIKLQDVTIGFPTTQVGCNNVQALWLDRVTLNAAGVGPIQRSSGNANVYLTHGFVTNWVQGLRPYTTQQLWWSLIRGNNLDGFNNGVYYFTALANTRSVTNGGSHTFASSASGLSGDYSILYNNKLRGFRGANTAVDVGRTLVLTNGLLVVQNVFEYASSNRNPNLLFVATDNGVASTNAIVAHNTIVGKRSGKGYNDSGTTGTPKWIWMWNNIDEIPGFKSDTFPDGGGSSNRIGNWQLQFGVGAFGNVFPNRSIDQAAGTFPQDFGGFGTWFGGANAGSTNTIAWPRFWSDLGNQGVADTVGGGDYRVFSDSPFRAILQNLEEAWVLRYDIDGNPRGRSAPPGAHATSNSRNSQ